MTEEEEKHGRRRRRRGQESNEKRQKEEKEEGTQNEINKPPTNIKKLNTQQKTQTEIKRQPKARQT